MYCRRKAFTGLMLAASLLALNGYASVSAEKAPNIWCSDDGLAFHLYSTSMGFQSEVINSHGQILYSMGGLDCKFSKEETVVFKCTPKWDMKGFVAMEGKMKATYSFDDQEKKDFKFRLAMQTQGKSGMDVSWNFGKANCMDLSVAKEGPSMPPQEPQPDSVPATDPSISTPKTPENSDFNILPPALPPPPPRKSDEPTGPFGVEIEELNKKNVNGDGVSVTVDNPRFTFNGKEVPFGDALPEMYIQEVDGICAYFQLGAYLGHTIDSSSDSMTVVLVDRSGRFFASLEHNSWVKNITCLSKSADAPAKKDDAAIGPPPPAEPAAPHQGIMD